MNGVKDIHDSSPLIGPIIYLKNLTEEDALIAILTCALSNQYEIWWIYLLIYFATPSWNKASVISYQTLIWG